MIRVLLVEDDEVFRLGLTVSIQQSETVEWVGTASDGDKAVSMALSLLPDLVLMDIGLPGLNGIGATAAIKAQCPEIKILILTSHSDPKIVESVLASGADGYCVKGVSTERLLAIIEDVYHGVFWVDAAVAGYLRRFFQTSPERPSAHFPNPSSSDFPSSQEPLCSEPLSQALLETLTEREQEVLGLIAQGKKNQEIADQLFISPGTVRVHVHAILHKLQVKDRTQAALLAVKRFPDP